MSFVYFVLVPLCRRKQFPFVSFEEVWVPVYFWKETDRNRYNGRALSATC